MIFRWHVLLRVGCLTLFALSPSVWADDWPQWLGPKRDSVWRETGIVDKFPEKGLPVKWRIPIAAGYSGPAVAGGKVFVTDFVKGSGESLNDPGQRPQLKGRERVLCFDAASGKTLWTHAYDCAYAISYPSGPRATSAIDNGTVFSLGAEGHLICLDANKGNVVWSKELKKEYKTESPNWGFCAHPLMDGNKLICVVGGENSTAVAFDKATGKELWRSLSARHPGYCPPTIIEAGGTRQLLIWDADNLNSLNPDTGKKYWSFNLAPQYDMSIASPRQSGELLFASGIGNIGACLKLSSDKPSAELLWKGSARTAVYCANSTPFLEDDMIYGCCCQVGLLRGVKLETGDRVWETFQPTTGSDKRASHGTAFLVKHQDRFFLFSETGDLILAKLGKNGYDEISRFHVLDPTNECFGRQVVWSHPAFANKCCFARNDKELVCVSLAK
jgi:outer membrane protein assembly factor BamB